MNLLWIDDCLYGLLVGTPLFCWIFGVNCLWIDDCLYCW